MKRIILEMGTGNDLYGEDYTKAACRAVEDAIRHSSLILFRSLGFDHADMQVKVTIGVQQPHQQPVDQPRKEPHPIGTGRQHRPSRARRRGRRAGMRVGAPH